MHNNSIPPTSKNKAPLAVGGMIGLGVVGVVLTYVFNCLSAQATTNERAERRFSVVETRLDQLAVAQAEMRIDMKEIRKDQMDSLRTVLNIEALLKKRDDK